MEYVQHGLSQYWSPEQIAGRLFVDFPKHPQMRMSFKTIYRRLQRAAQSHHPDEWRRFVRFLRLKRKGKSLRRNKTDQRKTRRNLPSIEQRPALVEKRKQFGHWECDLIRGFKGQGYLVTVVERKTGFLMAQYSANKSVPQVNQAIVSLLGVFPRGTVRTMTVDRGKEFYGFKELEKTLGTNVYFCHPYCPNERGLNEQVNGLLRQFFPKYKPITGIGSGEIQRATALINNRPKKKLGFRTTMEFIAKLRLSEV